MTKRVAILQSNYIPWKGYFDIINMVDVFIFYDDLQYTSNDWRNRNRIKTPQGLKWLSIPCGKSQDRLICDVSLLSHEWQKEHWKTIRYSYGNTPYFKKYSPMFEDFYLGRSWQNLSELNQHLIQYITREILGNTKTIFDDSRKYNLTKTKAARIMELLVKVKASHYLSGPAAKNYLRETDFVNEGISLEWMDYSGYREYPQLYPPFEHEVSIVDLIFHVGPNINQYLKSSQ